ncbi:MAG TPA: DUF5684 domain-containing protein, partial [Candidatus Saccharimonadales bacterium]|nr:DUF5684 domain-containing protein [Candidatus Saccharimonadales bacterium]
TLFGQSSDQMYDLYSNDSMYNTTNGTQLSDEAAVGIFFGTLLISLFIALVVYVIGALLLGRIFKKAGVEQWKAWVPIYNTWILLELGDQKGYWAVLMLIPFVNIVAAIFIIIAEYHIGLKLGKEGWFVLLAIFLPLVWLIWLAVDNSTWEGAPKEANGTPPTSPTPPATPTTGQTPPAPTV